MIALVLILVIIFIVGTAVYFARQNDESPASPPSAPVTPPTSLEYSNIQYGFDFSLPARWKGYTIVTQNWEGTPIDDPTAQKVNGSEILIRHPLWTAEHPRQDIPVMVFTLAQWDLVTHEKLSLGAAPIPPSELGHNARYVFALPARYNYAFPTGYEEVDQILQSKPLRGL